MQLGLTLNTDVSSNAQVSFAISYFEQEYIIACENQVIQRCVHYQRIIEEGIS